MAEYLVECDWNYSSDTQRGNFSFALRLRDGSVHVDLTIAESAEWCRIVACTSLPVYVPESKRMCVSEALHRINYAQPLGCVEMNFADGEIRARATLENDTLMGQHMISRAIRQSIDLAKD